jgi:hypothetical protein
MSIERGPSQATLKSDFFHFLAKTIFSIKFKHVIGFVLKNAIIDKKKLWIISRGCSVTVVFRLKKGYFQRLISRLRKLTLTRDLHQWKI